MKKYLLNFVITLFATVVVAQDVKIKKDTAYISGLPVCLVKEREMGQEYRILSLKGKELVFAKMETMGQFGYFNLTFLEENKQCEREISMVGFGRKLVRDLYERGALTLKEDGLNPEGLNKFLMTHTKKLSEGFKEAQARQDALKVTEDNKGKDVNATPPSATKKVKLVERDITKRISTSGKEINQDFKTIGTFKEESVSVTGKKITILSVDSVPIAEVIFKSMSDEVGEVFTFIDRETHSFSRKDPLNSFQFVPSVANFLVDKRYL